MKLAADKKAFNNPPSARPFVPSEGGFPLPVELEKESPLYEKPCNGDGRCKQIKSYFLSETSDIKRSKEGGNFDIFLDSEDLREIEPKE